MSTYIAAVNTFGAILLNAIHETLPDNVVISPLSIHQALMMTTNGAIKLTFEQLTNLLQLRRLDNNAVCFLFLFLFVFFC